MKWIALLYVLTNSYGSNGYTVTPVEVADRASCVRLVASHTAAFNNKVQRFSWGRCVEIRK